MLGRQLRHTEPDRALPDPSQAEDRGVSRPPTFRLEGTATQRSRSHSSIVKRRVGSRVRTPWRRLARDYRGADWNEFDPDALIEILRIANAIGNAAAQRSAMTQNARGPSAP